MNAAKKTTGIALASAAAGLLAMAVPSNAFAVGGCAAPHKASKPTTADKGGTAITEEASEKKGGKAEKAKL